uniref:KH and NYN domain containing n=1 Tax=Gasterosteus aculeatus TaxID=69293 RepID=G3Q4Z1_GASAC
MEGERSGAGGGEPPVEDEFACADVLRGPLASLHGTVERLFGVTFGLGADGGGSHGDGGQIWLKLRGPSGDVRAAKLFVKGLVNQEQQKEVSYPEVLHCIFCGARGLFVDGLTKNTSAHIVPNQVDSAGFLLISGLEEPVVRAYSLITDLVERYEGAQSGHAGPGESLDSRRAFKDLVEKWEDKHFLDLLALPGSVKEVLLGLVRESGLGLSPARPLTDRNALRREDSEDVRTGKPFAGSLPAGLGKDSATGDPSFRCEFADNRGGAEGAEGGAARSPPDVRAAPPQVLHRHGVHGGRGETGPRPHGPQRGLADTGRGSAGAGPQRPPAGGGKPGREEPTLRDGAQTTKRHGQATPRLDASPPKHMDPTYDQDPHPKHKAAQVPQPHLSPRNDPPPSGARDRRGFTAASSVVVTGEQRFLEGLLTPFDLQLTDQTGDPNVRAIIIDGSNVAMSHGLGHFFSCRGIALAVQHFWDRGHRHISALVPQWRQKSNPKIKEQHYLTELQKLGLLAYTPSREVQGKMISSYDDRFMLQHAQKTDGVIVTNDNLRDLSDESPVWRDIIKKRLLQYTFVGDHFMVPDDPLGRGGPHLDDFLRSGLRNQGTTLLPAPPRRSPPPSPRGKGRDAGLLQGRLAERGPEETAALREQLCQVFPGQDNMVALVLQSHPAETDINVLSDLLLEQLF